MTLPPVPEHTNYSDCHCIHANSSSPPPDFCQTSSVTCQISVKLVDSFSSFRRFIFSSCIVKFVLCICSPHSRGHLLTSHGRRAAASASLPTTIYHPHTHPHCEVDFKAEYISPTHGSILVFSPNEAK